MTDITKKTVKCAKCGKESQQLTVYSVNYLLGTKEDNDELLHHKQKCPFCGYEAINIEDNEKYDTKVEENIPQFVYGVPDYFLERSDDSDSATKYVARENNIKKKETKPSGELLVDIFSGGYFGPSDYYYIEKLDNNYLFKNACAKDGRMLSNTSDEMKVITKTQEEYDEFIKNIKELTKDWKNSYYDESVYDGNQWHINIINDNIEFSGSNAYPENFKTVFDMIDNIFNDKYTIEPEENVPYEVYGIPDFKQKDYNIKPEDNVPQRIYGIPNAMSNNKYDVDIENHIPQIVYGIPDWIKNKKDENKAIQNDTDCNTIRIKIKNNKNDYVLLITHFIKDNKNEIVFGDLNNLNGATIGDMSVKITEEEYNYFIDEFYRIISNWNEKYDGESNISWSIKIKDLTNILICGNGGFPSNWNDLIDLIVKYELIFKNRKYNQN